MKLWAIKHKPSGAFLSAPLGRHGRGGSHVEPSLTEPPRLFHTEHAAKIALTYWLKGKVTVTYYIDYFGEVNERWHTEPVPHRKREEMAIVQIELREIPCT